MTKSSTCFSKRTGDPLSAYHSEREAKESADYANACYGQNFVPYSCNRCGLWHLTPKDHHTPSVPCEECVDSQGVCKDLYFDQESAEKRAAILRQKRGVRLSIYQCPYNDGWHLTKKNHSGYDSDYY